MSALIVGVPLAMVTVGVLCERVSSVSEGVRNGDGRLRSERNNEM